MWRRNTHTHTQFRVQGTNLNNGCPRPQGQTWQIGSDLMRAIAVCCRTPGSAPCGKCRCRLPCRETERPVSPIRGTCCRRSPCRETRILWTSTTCTLVITVAFFVSIRKLNITMIFPKEAYDNWPDQPSSCTLVGPTRFHALTSPFFLAEAISKRMPFFVFAC